MSKNKKLLTNRTLNLEKLKNYVLEEINLQASANLNGLGLSEEELKREREQNQNKVRALRKCCSGDLGMKEMTKEIIKDKITEIVTSSNIDDYISFDTYEADSWVLFETCIYKLTHKSNPFAGATQINMNPFASGAETVQKDDTSYSLKPFFNYFKGKRVISITDLREYYEKRNYNLTYSEKLNILTQIIFAETYGLGVIDTLNYAEDTIEEIHLGMAGVLRQTYNYHQILKNYSSSLNSSKDKVHVIISGETIHLAFLSFKTNNELIRVLQNLIKDAGAGDITQENPRIVTDTVDGRRVTVARPPYQDSWGGHVRIPSKANIYTVQEWDKTSNIAEYVRLLFRSGCNIAITGEMISGKTTLLRAGLAECDPSKNIRIIERESFELDGRRYLPNRNVSSYRITDKYTEDDVLAFVRKTSGHIFSVGEVNSLNVANLTMNLAKVVPQVMFTAHHNTTEALIEDFKNAKLCNGFSSEKLAELESVKSININIHLVNNNGVRHIDFIDEIIPEESQLQSPDSIEQGLENIQKQLGKSKNYHIVRLYERQDNEYHKLNNLSDTVLNKAKCFMDTEDYFNLLSI